MPLSPHVESCVEEQIHGVAVRDPYRWLENGDSPETQGWVADQQRRHDEYFSQSGYLDQLRLRVGEYLDVETLDQPVRIANKYFYRRRDKGSEQARIYVRDISSGHERLLVEPSPGAVFTSVAIHCVSFDGSLLAYELRQGGADAIAIHIIDVESGDVLPDKIETGYAKGFTFTIKREGFYYCQEQPHTSEDHMIRFHRFGEESADTVVYRAPRSAGSNLVLTYDELHLGAIFTHLHNGERVIDLSLVRRDALGSWNNVFSNLPRTCRPFLKLGRIFAVSFQDAPNGMLIELNCSGCRINVIIPERVEAIQELALVKERVVVSYIHDWGMVVDSWTVSGKYVGRLDVPTDGTIRLSQFQAFETLFCTYQSFSEPPATFEFLPDSGGLEIRHRQTRPAVRTPCHMRPVVVSSKDGTTIPLLLASQNNSCRQGATPVIMTGYGGFGASVTPQYSVLASIMLELDSTFALARLRGGREYGEAWHEAGKRSRRQHAFDDFIAAAEWLITEGITTPKMLAIFGASNAGLLVGVVLTQRPELFGAVLCIAPLLDMVRYENFDHASRWREEYGSVDNADDFRTLHAYSPYHNIADDIDYPPVLFVSGDKDDRCNPAHVRKMAARLQQRDAQTHPILLDYTSDRGHTPVLPLSIRVESLARRITFLCQALSIALPRGLQ